MCAICVAFENEKLTYREDKSALLELINTENIDLEHSLEIADKIEELKGEDDE